MGSSWYSFLATCWYISSISRLEKLTFLLNHSSLVRKFLANIKSSEFWLNFYSSFSILSLCRTRFCITVKYIFVVFPRSFLPVVSLSWEFALVVVCISEVRIVNIRRMLTGSPYVGYQGRNSRSWHPDLFGFYVELCLYLLPFIDRTPQKQLRTRTTPMT